jgi:hypothetical protein
MFALFLLVLVVVFTWLCVRSVRAGWGKLLAWLLCLVAGLCLLTAVDAPPAPWNAVLANTFAVLLLGLPVWWGLRALGRSQRRSR